jgi:hypothetical protein
VSVDAAALTDLPPQDYDTVRALVRTGDLALCSGSYLFSRAIRWATSSPFSHVAMIVRFDEIDRVMVMEAVEKIGVRVVPFSTFVGGDSKAHPPYAGPIVIARHSEFAAKATPDRLKAMSQFATDRLGDDFHPAEITKIAIRVIAGALGVHLPRVLRASDEFICSEYVEGCYRAIGIEIPWDGRGFIAPADFARDPHVAALARVLPITPRA